MIGLGIQLLLNGLLLKWLGNRSLQVLGLWPKGWQARAAALHGVFTALACASGFGLKIGLVNMAWVRNAEATATQIAGALWWNLRSVLFEELIFRGALFYLLMATLGLRRGLWISAAAFGIYHWFSMGVLGQPLTMLFIFCITGIMGLVLGWSFIQTQSLWVPVAIHMGWNATQSVVFSEGSIGKQLLVATGPQPQSSLVTWLTIMLAPMLLAWLGNAWLLRFTGRPAPANWLALSGRIHSFTKPAQS